MEPQTRRRLGLIGLLLAVISPPFVYGRCSDHCTGGGVSIAGVDVVDFSGVAVTYCQDGSTCTVGLGPAFLVVGVALIGLALLR